MTTVSLRTSRPRLPAYAGSHAADPRERRRRAAHSVSERPSGSSTTATSTDGKDTLVIDTVGFNDKFWFGRPGTPHTEQVHTIERWTRVDMGHRVNEVTIDVLRAYSRPFTVTFPATLGSPGDEIMEYVCQENNQFGFAGGHKNPFAGP